MHLLALALTLAQAVEYALTHSPSVAKQLAVVAQAQSQFVSSRSQRLPNINGTLSNQMQKSMNYSAYTIIGVPQANVFSENQAYIGTNYTLYNGGLSRWQMLVARQQFEQSEADLRKIKDQIATDVSSGYYDLASKNETVRLDAADVNYQNLLVEISQAKVRAGVAAGVDVLSAQAQREKSRYALVSAQADSENSRETLAHLIGAPLETQFEVASQVAQPPLPNKPLEGLISLAQSSRPEVASAKDAVTIAEFNRRSADSNLLPQVQTFASFGNQFSPTAAVQAAELGTPVPRGNPGFWNIGVNSTLTLPFVDWGARAENHRSLNEQIVAADATLDTTESQVELDVRHAYRDAQTALRQIASAQQETRFATEASRIARLQYLHGLKSITDVFQAQDTALSAQTDLFNARVAYVDALVRLRVALGIYDAPSAVADLQVSQ